MGTTITDGFGDLLHWGFGTCSFQAGGWGWGARVSTGVGCPPQWEEQEGVSED